MLVRLFCAALALSLGCAGAAAQDRGLADFVTPFCRYDADVVEDDARLKGAIDASEYVFSGKVSDERVEVANGTITFKVFVKRFFKNEGSLAERREATVTKRLRDGEGVKCKQIVAFRYTGIFIGRKPDVSHRADVELTISPVSITLSNLERINAATKGK